MAIVVIINLNCSFLLSKNDEDCVLFYNAHTELKLKESEFLITQNLNDFDLSVLNNDKLNLIKQMSHVTIKINIHSEEYQAKGNYIYSSSVPHDSEYFYPMDEEKKIIFFKNNVVSIIKIN